MAVTYSTTNLQPKQLNGNFDTCICLVHLLPLYTSKMIMDQSGLGMYKIRIFNAEIKDNGQLKEYVNALFKDIFSL